MKFKTYDTIVDQNRNRVPECQIRADNKANSNVKYGSDHT